MKEQNNRNMRRRKRRRQKRRAWMVVTLLFICVLSVDFGAGFLIGHSWQKRTGQEKVVESLAPMDDSLLDTREDIAYCDGQNNTVLYEDSGNDSGTPWNLTLVNNWNPVPDGYEVNLVDIGNGECVDERIYGPLTEMLEDARAVNWNQTPRVVSGYRTEVKQQQIYEEKIGEYRKEGYGDDEAEELAKQWVAVPGHSEHQIGLAIDINGATYDLYLWLEQNSYRYGFIFRYPGCKTELTGVQEEVWHYRYVGVEAATAIYEQGICLEEYIQNMGGERNDREQQTV